jgi:metal transporter CNNM
MGEGMSMTELTWLAIAICITQSGTLSGLNLALFSLPRFQLEVKSREGHAGATRVLALRRDPNLLLTTIIWATSRRTVC